MASPLKIAVIGGAGFIGKVLVRVLCEQGHAVRIGDIVHYFGETAEYVRCDVRVLDQVRELIRGADLVYNLAAEHRDDVRPVEKYEEVNVGGARVLCEAATLERVRKLIFTSSVAVYGLPDRPVDETSPCRPFNEYGRTKLAAEAVYRAWAEESPDRSLVIVRPSVVFGEGNRGNVYNLLRQIASKRFAMVGDGRNRKSMAYVENVAALLAHTAPVRCGVTTLNYADSPDLDMNALVRLARGRLRLDAKLGLRLPYALGLLAGYSADLLSRLTRRSYAISAVRVRKFCAETRVVASRAFGDFTPAYTLQDGLFRFIDHEFLRPDAEHHRNRGYSAA